MNTAEPRDHHYAPQFYLRNFAADPEGLKINTVGKSGLTAVWTQRSIESVGQERDFYVHMVDGAPVSVETLINRQVETPISNSQTWRKIREDPAALDRSDRAVLYALVRHFKMRTPHALATTLELAAMAASSDSPIPFDERERRLYAQITAAPGGAKAHHNRLSLDTEWDPRAFASCLIGIVHSTIALRTSTTPVMAVRIPDDPRLALPAPGMTPYMDFLPLTPHLAVTLTMGEFGGAFETERLNPLMTRAFNQQRMLQYGNSEPTRHMITSQDDLVEDMTWGPYTVLTQTDRKIVFRRR
ncbi:MAG TPA: DUF4238 domain-containing protein [Caulobacter sp.]|nr:DUF4238 domain-containing protein [Caulobacter sp.]